MRRWGFPVRYWEPHTAHKNYFFARDLKLRRSVADVLLRSGDAARVFVLLVRRIISFYRSSGLWQRNTSLAARRNS